MRKKSLNFLFIFLFILNSCSFDNKTGIWKEHNKQIIKEVRSQEKIEKIFKKKEIFEDEIESKDLVILSKELKNISWPEDNLFENNDVPHLKYRNNKNQIFKSKKIGKKTSSFIEQNYEPLLLDNNLIFSDPRGYIFCYSITRKKLIWDYNFYKKKFKNIPIKINLKIISGNLIASDNLGYFYKINIDTGKLIWAKNQGVPLTSEIKSFNNKIFMLNQDNKFYIFDNSNGKKILDFETFPVILKKDNKQTLTLDKANNLYFVTSAGQLFSLNHLSYKINWLKNIKGLDSSDEFGLFFSSPIISKDNSIYLSTSQATMSIDTSGGNTNWEVPYGTKIRPIISNNFIFLVTKNGFIINLELNSGKIVWSKKLFKSVKVDLAKAGEITSIFLISDQLFITTKKGFFFFLNFKNGEVVNYAKVSKGFYSKPIVANEKIYIIDKNMSILVFD